MWNEVLNHFLLTTLYDPKSTFYFRTDGGPEMRCSCQELPGRWCTRLDISHRTNPYELRVNLHGNRVAESRCAETGSGTSDCVWTPTACSARPWEAAGRKAYRLSRDLVYPLLPGGPCDTPTSSDPAGLVFQVSAGQTGLLGTWTALCFGIFVTYYRNAKYGESSPSKDLGTGCDRTTSSLGG